MKSETSEYKHTWYLKNRERILAQRVEYRRLNQQKIAACIERWRKSGSAKATTDRMKRCMRHRLRSALRKGTKTGSAVRDLGCSIAEFRSYLEAKFQVGMTWGNYGQWHIDHIRPLSAFDLSDREQLLKAVHYTNLQPLWGRENIIKGGVRRGTKISP